MTTPYIFGQKATAPNTVDAYKIMGYLYMPSIGKTLEPNRVKSSTSDLNNSFAYMPDPSSAINVAARNIYAKIRYTNSGAKNYDAVDVIQYLYSVAEMWEAVCDLKRVYSIAQTYDGLNRLLGDKLIIAAGYIPEDVRANLPLLRYDINQLISKLRSFFLPKGFSFLDRRL